MEQVECLEGAAVEAAVVVVLVVEVAVLEGAVVVVGGYQSYCGVARMGRWRSVPRWTPPWLPAGPSLPWLLR